MKPKIINNWEGQVAPGKEKKASAILQAIQEAEQECSSEIRVHLTQRFVELNVQERAKNLFHIHQMDQNPQKNAVLIYVNLRKRKFAIIANDPLHKTGGQPFWNALAQELQENLHSTQWEKAIALTVRFLGKKLISYRI